MKLQIAFRRILSLITIAAILAAAIPALCSQTVFADVTEPAKRWDFDTEDSSFVQNRSVLVEHSPFGGNMLRLNVANAGAELIYPVDMKTVPSTFSMWISPVKGSMTQEQSLLHQKKKNNLISIQSDGHLSTAVTGEVYVSDATELVKEEKWNHVAVAITPEAESTSTHITLFLNGKSIMDETVQGMPPDGSDAPGFLLGKHRTDGKYFYGDIDNICFYNKALSESELSAIYAADSANLPTEPIIIKDLPPSYTARLGETVTLEIEASGGAEDVLTYRWYRDGTLLEGYTESRLMLENLQPEQYGTYYADVVNSKNGTEIFKRSSFCIVKGETLPEPKKIWNFEHAEGTNLKDDSGAVIGSLENGAVTSDSVFGTKALYLDGMTWAKLNGAYRFSDTPGAWSMWIQPDVDSFDVQMFKKRKVLLHPENTRNFLSIAPHTNGGQLYTYITGEAKTGSIDPLIKPGCWNHIAMTTNPVNGKLALYVNGECVLTENATAFPDANDGFFVGRHRLDDTDDFFIGLIDDIHYYGMALDDKDIKNLYQSEMPVTVAKGYIIDEIRHWDAIKNERVGTALYQAIEAFVNDDTAAVLSNPDAVAEDCLACLNQLKENTARYKILVEINHQYEGLISQTEMIRDSSYYDLPEVKTLLSQIEPELEMVKAFLHTVSGNITKEVLQEQSDNLAVRKKDLDDLKITIIKVDTSRKGNAFTKSLFGANHRYASSDPTLKLPLNGYGMWDFENDRVRPQFTTQLREAKLGTIRFPGGTCANLYQWKRAIGPQEKRIPTIHGQIRSQIGMPSEFGVDEAARMCEEAGSEMVYMYNMANGSVEDMLDLMEYLNAPATAEFPWAMERAKNGHPEPYGITRFEMGNEMNLGSQNYWTVLSEKKGDTYARGGQIEFQSDWNENELDNEKNKPYLVVKETDWTNDASLGDGTPNQIRYFRYHPVVEGTAKVFVNQVEWRIVDTLESQGKQNVCTVDSQTGEIRFGDGTNGNIPAVGSKIRAKYTADMDGFADYAKEMHEFANKLGINVEVYSCFDGVWFLTAMKDDFADVPWEGVAVHPYGGRGNREGSKEYFHDLLMGDAVVRVQKVQESVDSLRAYFPDKKICVSECGVYGSNAKYKWWINAAGNGVWIAKLMLGYTQIDGVSYACRHCLVDNPGRQDTVGAGEMGVVSIYYNYDESGNPESIAGITSTPSMFALQMLNTFYGIRNVGVEGYSVPTMVSENPEQEVANIPVLDIYASEDDDGYTYLAVINGSRTDTVTALIGIDEASKLPAAQVLTMEAPSFDTVNNVENPNAVQLVRSEITGISGQDHFSYSFAPISFTIIKIKTKGDVMESAPVSKVDVRAPKEIEAGVRFTAEAVISPENAEHVAARWKIIDGGEYAEIYEKSGLVQTHKGGDITIAAIAGGVESEPVTVKILEPFRIKGATLENNTVTDVTLVGRKEESDLFVAAYSEDKLSALVHVMINGETPDTVPINLNAEGADQIKVFLWNMDMQPIDTYILK